MSFFTSDKAFDNAKSNLDNRRGSDAVFFGPGRFHAKLLCIEVREIENPASAGQKYLWSDWEIVKVLEGDAHEVGDKVSHCAKKYVGDAILAALQGMTKGKCDPAKLTKDMANALVDPNNHDFDGQVFEFHRVPVVYEVDGKKKEFTFDLGLTKPVA